MACAQTMWRMVRIERQPPRPPRPPPPQLTPAELLEKIASNVGDANDKLAWIDELNQHREPVYVDIHSPAFLANPGNFSWALGQWESCTRVGITSSGGPCKEAHNYEHTKHGHHTSTKKLLAVLWKHGNIRHTEIKNIGAHELGLCEDAFRRLVSMVFTGTSPVTDAALLGLFPSFAALASLEMRTVSVGAHTIISADVLPALEKLVLVDCDLGEVVIGPRVKDARLYDCRSIHAVSRGCDPPQTPVMLYAASCPDLKSIHNEVLHSASVLVLTDLPQLELETIDISAIGSLEYLELVEIGSLRRICGINDLLALEFIHVRQSSLCSLEGTFESLPVLKKLFIHDSVSLESIPAALWGVPSILEMSFVNCGSLAELNVPETKSNQLKYLLLKNLPIVSLPRELDGCVLPDSLCVDRCDELRYIAPSVWWLLGCGTKISPSLFDGPLAGLMFYELDDDSAVFSELAKCVVGDRVVAMVKRLVNTQFTEFLKCCKRLGLPFLAAELKLIIYDMVYKDTLAVVLDTVEACRQYRELYNQN